MHWSKKLASCITAVSLVGLSASTASALNASTSTGAVSSTPITSIVSGLGVLPALPAGSNEETALMAKAVGESVAVATARMQRQQALSGLSPVLESTFGAQFAGASNAAGDGFSSTIYFKGRAPAAARALISQLPMKTRVVEGLSWSKSELQRTTDAITDAWADNPEVDQYVAYVDIETNSVKMEYRLDQGSDQAALVKELLQATAATLDVSGAREKISDVAIAGTVDGLPLGLPVNISLYAAMDNKPQILTGGTRMYNSQEACTAGFAVTKYGGTGLLSAEHCPDDMTYEGRPVMARAENMSRSLGDVQWQGSKEAARPYFVSNSTGSYNNRTNLTVSKVTGVANSYNDSTQISFHGMTGGRKSSNIFSDFASIRYPDGSSYSKVALNDPKSSNSDYTQLGDSGGPWFAYNTAYGVHSGLIQLSTGIHEVWTPAYRFQNDAGTRILTTS